MIVNAQVAKLNAYMSDPAFVSVMNQIDAATEEGEQDFELDLDRLEQQAVLDLMNALEAMGYDVDYYPDEATMNVSVS